MLLALSLIGLIIIQVFIPGFPKETLLISAGVNFGLIGGTLINWIGMVLAAQVGYEVVANSVKVGGRFANILETYQESDFVKYIQDRGNLGLFFIRLIPYAPNDILSLLAGALFLPRKGFILVSVITAFPFAVVFAYIGERSAQYFGQETIWLINLILFLLSTIVIISKYLFDKTRIRSN